MTEDKAPGPLMGKRCLDVFHGTHGSFIGALLRRDVAEKNGTNFGENWS